MYATSAEEDEIILLVKSSNFESFTDVRKTQKGRDNSTSRCFKSLLIYSQTDEGSPKLQAKGIGPLT